MPRAGFYSISSSHITFGKDGRWYSDGEPIVNARIADLFSRQICRHPKGGYQLVMGEERARIHVEDTPYVVTAVYGTPDAGFDLALNDGSREPLDLATLTVGPDHALSCAVKHGRERARLLRPAYYQLVPFITESAGTFTIEARGQRHRLRRL
jgi:hypothetical protein